MFLRSVIRKISQLKPSAVTASKLFVVSVKKRKSYCTSTNSTITTKTPKDSFTEKLLRFSSDEGLRTSYINHFGQLRIGLILEDLDRLAGAVAYKHVLGQDKEVVATLIQQDSSFKAPQEVKIEPEKNGSQVTIVTASCDRIDLFKPLSAYHDLRLQGFVISVGRSSMEVHMRVDSLKDKGFERVLEASMTMVARDHNKAYQGIAPLTPVTDEEQTLHQRAIESRELRKKRVQESLTLKPPTVEERLLLHNLFMNKGKTTTEVDMSSTAYQSMIVMHPQKRNIHNKVFGGYLMRLAYEQAWATAFLFSGVPTMFRAVDEINFIAPVDIGTVCVFNSMIVFTESNSIQVLVKTDVVDPIRQTSQTTNTFHFTFTTKVPTKQVLFTKYEDAMKYLEGKRRYEAGKACEREHTATQAENKSS
jgi:acyl-coenzyme A thioesterase 9